MLLYWGMFTAGFIIGTILSFMMFGTKNPQEDAEYKDQTTPSNNLNHSSQAANISSETAVLGNSL